MKAPEAARNTARPDIGPAGYGNDRSAAVCIWAGIFLMVMSVLTVLDLPVARAIYHYSDVYGRIFEIAGVVPTCMMGAFFAVSNLATRHIARRKVLSAVLSIVSILLFVGFTLLSISHLDRAWLLPMAVFSVLFLAFSVYANRRICRRVNLFALRKVMLIALFAALAAVMGQTIVKFAFNRPRFRTLTDPDTQYTPWFVHHPFALDSSFPSGHAAQSALVFLLLYLKRFLPGLRTRMWNTVFTVISVFITGSTMLSRMFLGAHYATDVWAGCFLTLAAMTGADRYVENAYTLPNYRLQMLRDQARKLGALGPEAASRAARLLEKIDTADLSAEKGELVLNLLEVREEADALLADTGLSGKEKRSLMRIRKLDSRFLREVRLRNYEDIYASAVK